MHTLRNQILFFGPTAAAGAVSLVLHRYMTANCLDDKGLLIAGNLPGRLLWVIGIGFALYLLVLLRTIGGDGSYEDNFPRCLLSGSLMLSAGVVLMLAVPDLGLSEILMAAQTGAMHPAVHAVTGAAVKVLPPLAAGSMAVVGLFRLVGKRPPLVFSGCVCLFYMLMLLNNYRLWSADPRLYQYVYPLLAGILLMLCSFHRTCCDGGIIQRKKLLFTGLMAALCAAGALSGGFLSGFYLASGLWAAGSMCSPAVLPPDPEEEEPSSDDAPEIVDDLGDVGDHRR